MRRWACFFVERREAGPAFEAGFGFGWPWFLWPEGGVLRGLGSGAEWWTGEGEVDEAFDAIDGGDVEGDAHARLDEYFACGPGFVVVFEPPAAGTEVLALDDAAQAHFGDFDHQAHHAAVGDECVEFEGLVHVCDAAEVFKEFDLFGFPLGFGGGALGVGDVAGDFSQVVFGTGLRSGFSGGFSSRGWRARCTMRSA